MLLQRSGLVPLGTYKIRKAPQGAEQISTFPKLPHGNFSVNFYIECSRARSGAQANAVSNRSCVLTRDFVSDSDTASGLAPPQHQTGSRYLVESFVLR